MQSPKSHPYFGQAAVLASKHEKLQLIEPAFTQTLQLQMQEVAVDTDQLGTFSGEIERVDSPLETAIKKARLGIESTGISLGIASEGSIGSDPQIPWIQSDYELVVLVDAQRNRTFSESFRSHDIVVASIEISLGDSLDDFLKRADFPRHALIVQPINPISTIVFKGIKEINELDAAISQSSVHSKLQKVRIQSDLRAMCSPSRRENIKRAAELLAARIAAQCPLCKEPGWGKIGFNFGAHCSDCGQENSHIARDQILGCDICGHQASGEIINVEIDPSRCNYCNP